MTRRRISCVTGMAAAVTVMCLAQRAPAQCDVTLADGPLDVTKGSIDFHVYYTEGTCGNPDANATPLARAEDVRDTLDLSYDLYAGFLFLSPYLTTLPDFNVCIYETPYLGFADADGIGIDSGSFCGDTDDTRIRKTTQHEMFHTIQRDYMCFIAGTDCGADGVGSTFGTWVSEGQARCNDDRLYDDLDSATFSGSFRSEIGTTFNGPDRSLFDQSYGASLFWSYCCEQLGTLSSEPEQGIDVIRRFWEYMVIYSTTDAADILDARIAASGGGSLSDAYLNYAIANYIHGYDLSALSNASLYQFVDELQAISQGEGSYPAVATHSATVPENDCGEPWISGDSSPGEYAFHVYVAPVSSATCQAVGFRAETRSDCSASDFGGEDMGFAVIGLTAGDHVVAVTKGVGREFGRTYVVSPTEPITKLAAIVVGLDRPTEFEYWFDTGPLTISVIRPTLTRLAYPGDASVGGALLVRLFVEGPSNLEPSGVGARSVLGLEKDDFSVEIGTEPAVVEAASYVGGEYWLVVTAPTQSGGNGLYDLTVKLCDTVSAVSANSVLYENIVINHMVVIDTSASMADPAGNPKLAAATNAANLYVDAVAEADRFGVVAFTGDGTPCDDDTTLVAALNTATPARRNAAHTAIDLLYAAGRTCIGCGLLKAQDQLDLYATSADLHAIMLLSDGMENEAPYVFDAAACDPAIVRLDAAGTVVNTIAFGPESDAPLLQDLAYETDGDHSYVDVEDGALTVTGSMANTLASAFMDGLERARRMQRRVFIDGSVTTTTTVSLPVTDAGPPRATIFFNVDNAAANLAVTLRNPMGVTIGPAQARIFSTLTHKVYHLIGPLAPGVWEADLTVAASSNYIAGVLARDPAGPTLLLQCTQLHNGGLGSVALGRFEQGRPVSILAILTDADGAIAGADVEVMVTKPDGTTACGALRLFDDGKHQDGAAHDGVYGREFTETAAATPGGVDNDTEQQPPPGVRGSYNVAVRASGVDNSGHSFVRLRNTTFTVFKSGQDADEDGLPDTWEVEYGTNPNQANAGADPDHDDLTNSDEFQLGSRPRNPDSDGGGETDGSEVAAGRCALAALDDAVTPPIDVEVVTDTGDERSDVDPNAILLRFPWHATDEEVRIYRAEGTPTGFVLYQTLTPPAASSGRYSDAGVTPGQTYFYRLQSVGADGALSRVSQIVAGRTSTTPGDLNCDGLIDFDDINFFVLALSDPAAYQAAFPDCNIMNGDCNGDGLVDFDDINAFVGLLSQ